MSDDEDLAMTDVEPDEPPHIIMHDGERVPLSDYEPALQDNTFIVTLKGRRVRRAKYKDGE